MEQSNEQLLETIVTEVPTVQDATETATLTVSDILTELGFHDYVSIFDSKGYNDIQDLQDMATNSDRTDWGTLINDVSMKPRHGVRLLRRLQAISSEEVKGTHEITVEKKKDIVMGWNEKQVWLWVSSKSYGEKLSTSAWEHIDGPTLLELTFESAKELQVHKILIVQLLKDIKSLVKESDPMQRETIDETTNDATLEQHLQQITTLENRLSAMDYRARVKELGKEFEGSLIRVFCIMVLTYAVLSVYMLLINVDRPWTSAIIPTMGFQLSTLPLPSIKACYVEHRMKTVRE